MGHDFAAASSVQEVSSFLLDACRIRVAYAAENMVILRHIALNVLKNDSTKKRGIKGEQEHASWDHSYFLSLLGF